MGRGRGLVEEVFSAASVGSSCPLHHYNKPQTYTPVGPDSAVLAAASVALSGMTARPNGGNHATPYRSHPARSYKGHARGSGLYDTRSGRGVCGGVTIEASAGTRSGGVVGRVTTEAMSRSTSGKAGEAKPPA